MTTVLAVIGKSAVMAATAVCAPNCQAVHWTTNQRPLILSASSTATKLSLHTLQGAAPLTTHATFARRRNTCLGHALRRSTRPTCATTFGTHSGHRANQSRSVSPLVHAMRRLLGPGLHLALDPNLVLAQMFRRINSTPASSRKNSASVTGVG